LSKSHFWDGQFLQKAELQLPAGSVVFDKIFPYFIGNKTELKKIRVYYGF